ncbi:MAG: hypothetical protein IJY46_07060 [Lentisphaeria bacterium]|nr:hypothetical protein [Lentisphaeria bacterium]
MKKSQLSHEKTDCGGASRAILRANRRIQLRSITVVNSLCFTLIYPQPCRTMHPPTATDHFERISTGDTVQGTRVFCFSQNKILQNHFFKNRSIQAEKSDKINEFSILWDSCVKK